MEEDYIFAKFHNLIHESVKSMKRDINNELLHLYKHCDRIKFTVSMDVVFEKALK